MAARDTLATINGVQVKSANTTFADAIDGVTLTVGQVTTAPVEVSIKRDTAGARSNITAFVDSYNALNNALAAMTRYNPADKSAGTLQGDSTAVGLQSALRQLVGGMGTPGGTFGRLSDLGVQFQADGTLKVDATKLDAAMSQPDAVKAFFATDEAGTASDGMAVRIKDFATGMLGVDGLFATKTQSLQGAVKRNSADQERVVERASRREEQLLAQYNRLDANLGKLNALSTYVNQQVTMWNKQGSKD
jgi:flagellar hook-associated protein 2